MSLSKQLYFIISIIFLVIFIGNSVITIQNTKEYLKTESISKAQDTATSIGMILKSIISNKKDPEIKSTIMAISDSGFYESIRLEDMFYTFTDKELIQASNLKNLNVNITDISIDKKYGEVITNNDNELLNELNELENTNEEMNENTITDHTYTFIPSNLFKDNSELRIQFMANNEVQYANLRLSKVLVEATKVVKFDSVPSWFINLIDLKLEEQKSEINNNWKITAVVYVKANAGIAYLKLYEQFKQTIIYNIFAFIGSILLLIIFLKLILKPLRDIENLSYKIANGSFDTITEIPWTSELKNVALSMNIMSNKIKNIIVKLNKNVKDVSDALKKDNLTSLNNKETFINTLKDKFINKEKGYVFLLRISDLGEFAKVNGQQTINNFLIEFAKILKEVPESQAFRFYGAEFAMIVNEIDELELNKLTKKLKEDFIILAEKINKKDIANIGIIGFDSFDNVGEILSGVTEAYEMAKQVGPNELFIKDKNEDSRGLLEWKELVFDIIDNKKVEVNYIGDVIDENENISMKEAFSKIKDNEKQDIPIGIFLSIAQENNRIIDFDKIIIMNVINRMKKENIKYKVIVNLATQSIADIKFLQWLRKILEENKQISNQLIFSLTAYSVAKDIELFVEFVNFTKQNNTNSMIKRFDLNFIEIEDIQNINPTCIRLARDYTNGITQDINKKAMVDSICKITELLGIEVFAENVKNDDDYKLIKTLGTKGISR
jgi:EAL domain-containing protein (putative c-di-GMP-specific phosphodiesterase class I)/uncharacterized membrane protein